MANDFDDDSPRPRRSQDSGGSVVKILLLIFGSLACLTMLACCGGGVFIYFKAQEVVQQVQKATKDIALTNPDDIRRVTGDITDITIPPQFVSKAGNALLGTRFVLYEWCPTGVCDPAQGNQGGLTLVSVRLQGTFSKATLPDMSEANFTDEELAKTMKNFTKTEHQFDIRQRRCRFFIIEGETLASARTPQGKKPATAKEPGASPIDVPDLSLNQWAGQKIVKILGRFPGKDGECALMMQLKADQFNKDNILAMLKSIR
jgi:hypothetical protein